MFEYTVIIIKKPICLRLKVILKKTGCDSLRKSPWNLWPIKYLVHMISKKNENTTDSSIY